MGDYKYRQDTSSDATGIVRNADGAIIPPNTELGAWRAYLDWKAVPNTPDPATATTLASKKRAGRHEIDRQGEAELAKDLEVEWNGAKSLGAALFALYEEARRGTGVGSPSAADYPLINALPAAYGATLADKIVTVKAEWDARTTRAAAVIATWKDTVRQIDAAGSLAAVDSVVAGVSWPA